MNRQGQVGDSDDLQRRPTQAAAAKLTSALRDLHLRAGKPSARSMAKEIGDISHTTVSDILKGSRVGSWKAVSNIGRFLSADQGTLQELWAATQESPTISKEIQHSTLWDPIYLDRAITTVFLRNKHVEERITERWISATRDGVDSYLLRTSLVNLSSGGGHSKVDALLNCSIGQIQQVDVPSRGSAQLVNVLLPSTLKKGESCFFSTRVRHSGVTTDLSHTNMEITGHGADKVTIRVQFAMDCIPSACWSYAGGADIAKYVEPTVDSAHMLHLSQFGYVERTFMDLPPAVNVGVSWRW